MTATIERPRVTVAATEEEAAARTPWRLIVVSVVVGAALAILWFSDFVDDTIGGGITSNVLGKDGESFAITNGLMGAGFAFVTGVAGTFTACNIAVFGALAPMIGQKRSVGSHLALVLKPVAWMMGAAMTVAGVYGAIGVYIDGIVPTLSETNYGDDLSGRRLQAAVVFSTIGVILVWRALAAIGVVRHPLARMAERHPRTDMVLMGALVGAFVIGRPWGTFRNMYEYAGSTDNPIIGFSTFALQALGNVFIVALVFVIVMLLSRGRLERFMTAKPTRLASLTASSLLVAGTFFILYWGVKSGARAGGFWWPTLPWQN
ncbi:MAG: hypothetical protein ACRD29_20270 [Acidimicrobiales bacterium]